VTEKGTDWFIGPRRLLRHMFAPDTMPLILLILVSLAILVAMVRNHPWSDVSAIASTVVPIVTLIFLLGWHHELLAEQAKMRRLQTRPQVLVYFDRKPKTEVSQ
jgi:hypothetical protein